MLAGAKLQTIICTSRLEIAQAFYSDVLGLPVKGQSHGAWVYDVDGQDLRLSPVPSTAPSAHTVLGFAVPDIAAVVSQLRAHGIETERFDTFQHDVTGIWTARDGTRVAWIRDPDGNLLSFVQYPLMAGV